MNPNPRLIVLASGKRVWEATIRVDGKYLRKRYRLKAEAECWLTQKRHDRDRGLGLIDDDRLTVRQYGQDWLERQSFGRDNTGDSVRVCLNRLFGSPVGDKRLSKVLPSDIEGWLKGLKTTYQPSTCRVTYVKVRAMFEAAVRDRKLPVSPCRGVMLRLPATPDIVVPTVDEIARVHRLLPERWRDAALIGMSTGLRPGELLGLCEDQCRLTDAKPHIVVDRQLKRGRLVPYTKTARSYGRKVPLDPESVTILMVHLAMFPPDASGRLFPARVGTEAWPHAVAKAGIGRRLRMHDLRHFYATHLVVRTNGNWPLVAELLGDSTNTVQRTYAHVLETSRDDVVAWIAELFATFPRHD